MEIFKNVSFDWLGKKWYFIGGSWVMLLIGVVGYFVRGGLAYGIDFTGGTLIIVKFNKPPDLEKIRSALDPEAVTPPLIQTFDDPSKNTVQIRVQRSKAGEDVEASQKALQARLRQVLDPTHVEGNKLDFNNTSLDPIAKSLIDADPDNLKSQNKTTAEIETHYRNLAASIMEYRNKTSDGLVNSLDDLRNVAGVSSAVIESLKKIFVAGPFAIKAVESVGAIVGSDLRRRAALAVGLSLLGMSIYIGFRFKPIYGAAAVVAVFHDVAITVGLFALTQREISLTVVAALLTLVGYSVNDTIVIFDRVRENLRSMRKETLGQVINISINQTMSRTILTSGFTFLAVLSIYLFGGGVLNGFSFALTVGIIIGTYSTIGIAGPIVELWYRTVEHKSGRKAA